MSRMGGWRSGRHSQRWLSVIYCYFPIFFFVDFSSVRVGPTKNESCFVKKDDCLLIFHWCNRDIEMKPKHLKLTGCTSGSLAQEKKDTGWLWLLFFFVSTCMDTAVLPGCWNTSTVMSERKCNSGVHTLHPDRVLQLASLSFYHIWHGISIAIFFHLIVDFCKNWYGTTLICVQRNATTRRFHLELKLGTGALCDFDVSSEIRFLAITANEVALP